MNSLSVRQTWLFAFPVCPVLFNSTRLLFTGFRHKGSPKAPALPIRIRLVITGILGILLLSGTGIKARANEPALAGRQVMPDGRPPHVTTNEPAPVARQGVLDLRKADFNKIYSLDGEWGFYWKRLLTPDSGYSEPPRFVQVPGLWETITMNGRQLPAIGYATYQLTVLLPAHRPALALEIPDAYSSFTLYGENMLLASNGIPATTAEKAVPYWSTRSTRLLATGDTLRLLLQVANFWHSKGGPYKSINLGPIDKIVQKKDTERAYDLLLTGCLFMGGLLCLGLYFFGRRDPAILYFSLFCILYSYRMIGTERYVLHSIMPGLSWFITVRLEYIVLALSIWLFARYTQCLFPEDTHKNAIRAILVLCLLYAGIILIGSPYLFSSLLHIFLGSMFVCAVYSFYVYIQAVRHRRAGSAYALAGISLLLVILVFSNLKYFGLIAPYKGLIFSCYIAFFFLQSLAISHRFAQSFRLAMEEAQQGLKTKSEFLSTMSHEIRTPLNAVIGMAHLLKKGPRPDQQEHLDVLLFSANNLLSIVNNILDYSKIEAGKISFEFIPMDLSHIARNIASGVKNSAVEKNIELRLDIDSALNKPVLGDPTRFSQVINNLLQNAIKFTKEGWVRLKMEVVHSTETSVTVTISVQDTGIGIEADKQQLIFERFSQAESSISRSYGGSGLGLSISQKILQLKGAELKLESKPGEGSCFYFTQTFPLSPEELPDTPVEEEENKLEGVSILLTEDNPFNVMLAQTILQDWGVKVTVATNGQEALDKLEETEYDLVLMDLHMPVMDGYEATRRIRERGMTLPVIALTAHTPGEIEPDIREAGLTDILVKPFNPQDLFRVVVRHLPQAPHK